MHYARASYSSLTTTTYRRVLTAVCASSKQLRQVDSWSIAPGTYTSSTVAQVWRSAVLLSRVVTQLKRKEETQ